MNRELQLLVKLARIEASKNFISYFKMMMPNAKPSWFQDEICEALHQFFLDILAFRSPVLIISAPPQHGKSELICYFLAWLSEQAPNLKSIYTSYSARLGIRANLHIQRALRSDIHKKIFPSSLKKDNNLTLNRSLIEYRKGSGSFRNTTINGGINGEGLDVGIIDDPIKGRAQARSAKILDGTWEWLTNDFLARCSEQAGIIVISKRWSLDDPAGMLLKNKVKAKVLSYKALATEDEKHRKKGEALFPAHKSRKFLLKRKGLMSASNWSSSYQQDPQVDGGGIFKTDKWQFYNDYNAAYNSMEMIIQSWDMAFKGDESSAYVVGQVWGKKGNLLYLLDQVREKMDFTESKTAVIALTAKHPKANLKIIENKANGPAIISALKKKITGILEEEPASGKVERAYLYSDILESKRIFLPCKTIMPWVTDFLLEHAGCPNGKYWDQIDAAGQAVMRLANKKIININYDDLTD